MVTKVTLVASGEADTDASDFIFKFSGTVFYKTLKDYSVKIKS